MMMSPDSSNGPSLVSVASTTAAGTISQIALGFSSFPTNSSSEVEPFAPASASLSTGSACVSNTTH